MTDEKITEFQRMIYEFGMRNHTNTVTGHPVLCWQMHVRHGTRQCTVYGKNPEDVCDKAAMWLKEKGWWNAGDND